MPGGDMPKSAVSQQFAWLALFAATVICLTAPAVYNGFPLLFPDTNVYMKVAYGHSWTLDRPGFYGLLMKPLALSFPGRLGPWLMTIFQCGIVASILIAAARRMMPAATPLVLFLIAMLACILTSLPWHAAQLMPDAFAGALVLMTWLAASRSFDRPGTALLWLGSAFLALLHYTYLGVAAVAAATTIAACKLLGASFAEIAKRGWAAILMLAFVATAHTATNGLLFGRWTVSPTGAWFLFARLNEDGLVPLWMDRHCGRDAPSDLCELRPALPQDSQKLLWSKNSPFYPHIHRQIGSDEYWRWIDMLSIAVNGSIREQPMIFASSAVAATGRQLAHYAVLDDKCPRSCTSSSFKRFNPHIAEDLRNSRQLRDKLGKRLIRSVVGTATTLSLLLWLPFLWWAHRNRDRDAIIFLYALATSLVANAAIAGALSEVNDRYQSRIVWIVPFAQLVLLVRWKAVARQRRKERASIGNSRAD